MAPKAGAQADIDGVQKKKRPEGAFERDSSRFSCVSSSDEAGFCKGVGFAFAYDEVIDNSNVHSG